MTRTTAHTDTVDVAEAVRAVRRGWRLVLAAGAVGLLLAAAVVLFAPRRFDGSSSIVIRESASGGGSLLSRLAGGAGAVGGMLGMGATSIKTEVEVLQSREMVGRVVDSLGLQARVRSPRGLPASRVVADVRLRAPFKARDYEVMPRGPDSVRLVGKGEDVVVRRGEPARLTVGTLVVRREGALPPTLALRLYDREDAITRTQRGLHVLAPGGEVIEVSFGAGDSVAASQVPNALIATYLEWRRGTDRGVNRHRVEFLAAQSDTVAQQLARAERELRRFQEASGVIEPATMGKLTLERAGDVRSQIGAIDVERGALDQLLAGVQSGKLSARQLAAFPSFLRSPAINELLSQMSALETQRTGLLERRLESDRSVATLDQSIRNLEGQLVPLAAAYGASLDRQRTELGTQLDAVRGVLAVMPAASESAVRLQRDVLRLGQIHAALQAQLVDARLAAVGEGGDVRQLDVAQPPKTPAFPKPATTLAAGVGGGLIVGLVLALLAGILGRWIDDPRAIERTAGVPALRLDTATPLLVAGAPAARTILLVPIDERTSTGSVARRLARTALARGTAPTVLDLSGGALPSGEHGAPTATISLEDLETDGGLLIVQLPGLSHDLTVASFSPDRPVLLVAAADRIERQRLLGAVETLRRLEVPCAGVVLNRTADALTPA